jgi:hypothetical protein
MNRFIYVWLITVFFSCKDEIEDPTETNTNSSTNRPPIPIGGPDRTITLPDTASVRLDGTRSYDPDGTRLALEWSQISGPTTFSFYNNYSNPGDAHAVFATSGKYLFRLTASDNKNTTSDTVEITVKWASDCNPNREMVSSQIVSLALSPRKIGYAPVCAIGTDKLVLAGGVLTEPFWPDDPPATYSPLVHVYDMKSNTWAEWEMLQAKGLMAGIIAGNRLFLGGGVTNAGKVTNEVEIHDLSTRVKVKSELSIPRLYMSVATAGNKVVFAGGIHKDDLASDAVDIYDLSSNTWSVAKLSQPRVNMSTMVSGSKIYFVGGSSSYSFGLSNSVDIYDAATGSWSVQRLSREGAHFQTALLGNKMVLSGGMTGQVIDLSTRVEFVDLSNWSSVSDCLLFPPYPDYGPGGENLNVAVIGDKIYFGSNGYISVFDSAKNLWKYTKLEFYEGMLFTYQGHLYSFRYEYGQDGIGQYQVIRIGI